MTTRRDPESLLAAYLADGIDVLPDRVVDAVLDEAHRTRQRVVFGPRRTPVMNGTFKVILAAAAVIAVAVLGFGVALLPRSNPAVGSGPSAPPSDTPASRPSSSSSPTLAPISLTGQIALERTVDGNADIYMMNLDRTGLVRLTDDPAIDHHTTWSPDGRTLFFSRETSSDPEESDIYALDVESGVETRLTDRPGRDAEPRVSPDGRRIAYDSGPVGAAETGLYVMDVDGSGKRFVLRFPADLDGQIGWSADGASLYYDHAGSEILRVDVGGGEPVPVVDGDHDGVSLSPDGSTFAFHSDRAPGGVFLMDVDGSDVRHVPGAEGCCISWAPAGDRLAFIDASGWINLVRTDGSELTRWTNGDAAAWRPEP